MARVADKPLLHGAERLHQAKGRALGEQLLQHRLVELHAGAEFRQRFAAFHAHELQHQAEQAAAADPRGIDRERHGRGLAQDSLKLLRRQQAQGDDAFSQQTALLALPIQGSLQVFHADQSAHQQDVAQTQRLRCHTFMVLCNCFACRCDASRKLGSQRMSCRMMIRSIPDYLFKVIIKIPIALTDKSSVFQKFGISAFLQTYIIQ